MKPLEPTLPGPISLDLSEQLKHYEASGINTLYGGQPAIVWKSALGSTIVDVDDRSYYDFTSGFGAASVGHRHPDVLTAIKEQCCRLVHGLGDVAAHPTRITLASKLCQLAPFSDPRVYFAISGADAVEIALKTALLSTGRKTILAFEGAYHGLTLGALGPTSRAEFKRPFLGHLHPYVVRAPWGASKGEIITLLNGEQPAAFILEPILGREGIIFPPKGWIRNLADLCSSLDALFIADEIFVGGGRIGPFWALGAESVVPDLLCVGKALGGGLPMAAVIGRERWMNRWPVGGEALHTATFVAHPLACAASLKALDVLLSPETKQNVKEIEFIMDRYRYRFLALDIVVAFRGRGALWAVELGTADFAQDWVDRAKEMGVWVLAGGAEGRVLQLIPTMTTKLGELTRALDLLLLSAPGAAQ